MSNIRRRTFLLGTAAIAAAVSLPVRADDGFIGITNDGTYITSPMPPDETVVIVRLDDGSITRAWYSCNIMDAGDWDFMPVLHDDEPDMDANSIADRVVAWRRIPS